MKNTYNLLITKWENREIVVDLIFDNYIEAKSQFFESYPKVDSNIYHLHLVRLESNVPVLLDEKKRGE